MAEPPASQSREPSEQHTSAGGAYIRGDVVNSQVTQVSGDQYILQLGLPSVSSLAAGRTWRIRPPVRSFTGRDEQLAALRAQLTSAGAATLVPTAALYGMGGIGKTQLALAYAQRYRAKYQFGWWVPAETELDMLTALAELGVSLGLPRDLPLADLAAAARDALGEHSGWLLIFDNVPDPDAVANFLPAAGGGHVLVTSRNAAWHGIADPVPVDLLPLDAAVGLLQRRSGDPDTQAAARLAEALGRLPLALEQAAAYAAQQRLSLASYLELFRERRAELLKRGKPLGYHGTVDATFALALEQLGRVKPAAVQLLQICAMLAPDELPIHLLLGEADQLPDPLAGVVHDPLEREELKGALYRGGLLAEDVSDTARIHRLVQVVALHQMRESDRSQLVAQTTNLLAVLFPSDGSEPQNWPRCAQLLPHVQALLDHATDLKLIAPSLARLLVLSSEYLRAREQFTTARDYDLQALYIYGQIYGDEPHFDVVRNLNNLSADSYQLRDIETALDTNGKAFDMLTRLYGDNDHPDIALVLSRMAILAMELRVPNLTLQSVKAPLEEALAMRQRLYQGDHIDIVENLRNLAAVLGEEEPERARALNEQALAMSQRLYNGDHPQVVVSLTNLASTMRELGQLEQARELNEQALEMSRRVYNGDHPAVVRGLTGLAITMRELGQLEQARELNEQALEMSRRVYQGDHVDIVNTLANLSLIVRGLGELELAQELEEQVTEMASELEAPYLW